MGKEVPVDILALDIDKVSKTFYQWQRQYGFKNIWNNLFHPVKKELYALDNISFQVQQGEFVAYAGANGAGKSTTLKILAGMLQPTSGKVSVLGKSPKENRVELMREVGVLYGQRTELWWDHPVISSFEWKKAIWNIPDDVYQRNFAMVYELLELKDILHTFSRELSLGQRLRADIAMLLLHEPKVIFLDEPTLGLDVRIKKKVISILREINRTKHATIIVTSHDSGDLEIMAKRILLLSQGKLIYDGSFNGLRHRKNLFYYFQIERQGKAPTIPGFELEETDGLCHRYKAIQENMDINSFLSAVGKISAIKNIEIGPVPIEKIISQIYEE